MVLRPEHHSSNVTRSHARSTGPANICQDQPARSGDHGSRLEWLVKPDFGVRSQSGNLPARMGSMGPDLRVYRPAGVGTRRQQVPPVTLMPWHPPQMAGGSAQGDGSGSTQPEPAVGVEFFIAPIQVNHRRYEALQAFFVGRPDPRPGRRQVQIDPVGGGQPQTPLRIRLKHCPQPPARKSALIIGNIGVKFRTMTRHNPTALLISLFVAMVVLATAIVVVVIYSVTGSWVSGWFTLLVSGVITISLYPLVFRRKSRPHTRRTRNS